jgi:hypothetical protein
MDPINYNQDIATPFQSAMQGFQAGTAIQDTQFKQRAREFELQQAQLAGQQQQQQQQIMAKLASNPNATGKDFAKAILMIPANREGIAKAWETKNKAQQDALLGDLAQYGSALQAGRPDLVYQAMHQRADSMEKTGGETNESRVLRAQAETIKVHPELGFGMIEAMAAMHPDGKKVVDAWASLKIQKREDQKLPGELSKLKAEAEKAATEAEISAAKAGVAVPLARAELLNAQGINAERSAKSTREQEALDLEHRRFIAEQAATPGGVKLSEPMRKIAEDAADGALTSRQSASKAGDLAAQLTKADPNSFLAGTHEWIKKYTGQQDYITSLRNETNRMLAGDAMRAYRAAAPGTFSDADLKQAMKGLPDEKAPVAQMASYLRGIERIHKISADISDAKSEWISQVGSSYKSAKDMQIGDTVVPRGTTFNQYVQQKFKSSGAQTQPEQGADAAARLMQKWGNFGAESAAPAAAKPFGYVTPSGGH